MTTLGGFYCNPSASFPPGLALGSGGAVKAASLCSALGGDAGRTGARATAPFRVPGEVPYGFRQPCDAPYLRRHPNHEPMVGFGTDLTM